MLAPQDLGSEIRDTRAAARALLRCKRASASQAINLQKKLLHLADCAADIGWPFSEICLEQIAEDIDVKMAP